MMAVNNMHNTSSNVLYSIVKLIAHGNIMLRVHSLTRL